MPTKKSVVTAAPKKTVVGRAKKASAPSAKPGLVYASNEQSFWTASGEILNSLVALRDALSVMTKDTFAHHVGTGKHDFATWVEVVLKDSPCATDLRKAKTATSARTVVVRHLKRYDL